MPSPVYVLGGYQTDFKRNWAREGLEIFDMFRETLQLGLDHAQLDAGDIETAHVGNFTAELFCNQGHLGGFFAAVDPALAGIPAGRHEGACASGSLAILGAAAEIEAGRYGVAAVLGIEMMRNVPGDQAAANIGGAAMWSGHECQGVKYPWPHLFSRLGDEYDRRYGLQHKHLAGIAKINFDNAKRNPNAQTRAWSFDALSFTEDDEANPVIDGRIRKQDCGQVTDGAAILFLASAERAHAYAAKRGIPLEAMPRIEGWGHRTASIAYDPKIAASRDQDYVFPHVRGTITDAFRRAGISGVDQVDGIETHDCFTTTEYMAIDHFGITPPGQSWRAVEDGSIAPGGRIPINPSGGLIGLGHPVGATGVRMLLDAVKQVTGKAGNYQVDGAKRFQTLNIGGSATTTISFVVGRG
ncbi:MAG: thiolase domain-containing protein [Alphaproteobacteria bacterium]|nr:thiolase domain-containing protein [Alphaproteobacteria bacterium]